MVVEMTELEIQEACRSWVYKLIDRQSDGYGVARIGNPALKYSNKHGFSARADVGKQQSK